MALTPIKAYPNFGTRVAIPPVPAPATLASNATWDSDLMPSEFAGVVACCLLSAAGILTIQRFADLAGLIPVGAAITQNLAANTAAFAGATDGLPFLSFHVTIQNTDIGLATLSNVVILTGGSI